MKTFLKVWNFWGEIMQRPLVVVFIYIYANVKEGEKGWSTLFNLIFFSVAVTATKRQQKEVVCQFHISKLLAWLKTVNTIS